MANIRIDYIRNKTDYIAMTTTMYRDNYHEILLYGYIFKMNFSGYLEYSQMIVIDDDNMFVDYSEMEFDEI